MDTLSIFQAFILGIIQGLTEFLPVSSSGHLILTREVFNFPDPGKTFDILMHFGTLIALIIYFRDDLIEIANSTFKSFKQKKFYGSNETNLFWFLIISTIPGALFGLLFNDKLEDIKSIYIISTLLIIFGIFLFVSDITGKKTKEISQFTFKDAAVVGLAQALALFPGVSRSGITMTAALFLGFSRASSARYSFLISIPLIVGISIYGLIKIIKSAPQISAIMVLIVGFIASMASGFLCIKFLLGYLKKGTFKGFVIYREIMGVLLIILGLMGIIK
ncbi:MAG: undecaprenyl-diphosphatase UppP [Vulcanimicrobiota bacterium]